jgi:hypothetical protein
MQRTIHTKNHSYKELFMQRTIHTKNYLCKEPFIQRTIYAKNHLYKEKMLKIKKNLLILIKTAFNYILFFYNLVMLGFK